MKKEEGASADLGGAPVGRAVRLSVLMSLLLVSALACGWGSRQIDKAELKLAVRAGFPS